ncbi:YHS domain-containing (seleno)protein [Pinisolibacter aquiterrae]|uniref:YHS domain-containing (seleno)protein n=1 Tax=Pinisolibacter aquiterrae TaxID=2815579 RepID=UPI001C3D1D1C|nr:YHS domain-containing (seleno)protein [Pinisolibacter aquiterrae]MBV5263455.1 hypothetical protein [Pinisolibacter aquiterrae]MCC8237468.1 hypothetical protein [Pinisolibacter aquiterrae]
MSDFSGIRATARRNRDGGARARSARLPLGLATVLACLAAAVAPGVGRAEDPHAATPAPATPAVPEALRSPPPRLSGPIAAARPRPRLTWLADPESGRALGGYDPVAYFLFGRPEPGDSERQLDWGGTTWLFVDEGTRAAFREAPEAYAPLFGGHCAFAVAQGRPAEGSPQFFLIHRQRLLLFADAVSRAAFLLDPDRRLAEAERRWPDLLADLP